MSAIIRREVFANAAEGFCLPTGEYVVALLGEPAVLTDAGRVAFPEPVRYPVMAVGTAQGRKIAAQGAPQESRSTWEYVESDQKCYDRGGNSGERPVVFLPDGTLIREPGGPDHPTEGWAGVDGSGPVRIVRFDPARDLHEVTYFGPFAIGQSSIDGIELQFNRQRYQVEPGDVHTIWAVLGANGVLAIATRKLAQNETVCLWVDVNRITELPLAPTKPPVIVVPPIIDPTKEPTVPAFPFPDGFNPRPLLEGVRGKFPTPLGDQHARFLIDCCQAVGHGAGLLKKGGGTRITLPNGVSVSQDWMVFQNGSGCDFLGDGEGAATVGWGDAEANPGEWVDVSGMFTGGGDPGGDPDPKPDTDLARQVAAIAALVTQHGSRLSAVERVADGNSSQLVVAGKRTGDLETRIAAIERAPGGGGGTPVPADLAKQIVAELVRLLVKAAA